MKTMKTMKLFWGLSVATVFAAGVGTSAGAAVLVSYENDALAGSSTSAPPATVAADVSATAITLGTGQSPSNQPDHIGILHNNLGINTLAAAISNNKYLTLTLTPDAGQQVTYTGMSVLWGMQNNTATTTNGATYALLSSATGFAAGDVLDQFDTGLVANGSTFGSGSFAISDAALTDNASAVEFRVYIYNNGTTAVTRAGVGRSFATDGADDLVLNGTVSAISAVPEPRVLALAGLALLAVLGLGRGRWLETLVAPLG